MDTDISNSIRALEAASGIEAPAFPRSIFHYTNLDAAICIIESGKLRLSSARYLNDTSELTYSLDLIQDCLRRRLPGAAGHMREICTRLSHLHPSNLNAYASCFCANGDLLSQWRGYAGGNGVSLGFDPLALQMQLEKVGGRLRSIIYERQLQCERVDRILQTLETELSGIGQLDERLLAQMTRVTSDCLLSIAPFFKSSFFAEEAEWRAVIELRPARPMEGIRMRAAKGLLVPFIEWDWRKECDAADLEHLNKIVIGPGQHAQQNSESMNSWFWDTLDYPFVEVTKSAVPLRA